MKLAFCLFRYFPYGGLQRDFSRIAVECLRRGHSVHVFVGEWEGEILSGAQTVKVNCSGLTSHARCLAFARKVEPLLDRGEFDVVVGFNKMPGLNLYYAADPCFKGRAREKSGFLHKFSGRSRSFIKLEESVFSKDSATRIMLISPREKAVFQECYATQDERFELLPPGVERDRLAPGDAANVRTAVRAELQVTDAELVLLLIGSAFRTKGVDRAIRAVAAQPELLRKRLRLVVAGHDDASSCLRLAKRLGVETRIQFLGGRDDVPRLLLAADLLVHPARTENTGTVLLEALAAGLPVLASAVCGYGQHVLDADAGMLIPEPFSQERFNQLLETILEQDDLAALGRNAGNYVARTDIFSMVERAVDLIEQAGRVKRND